jgi:hypothetical protein
MSQTTPRATAPLTVVLVHGAFADASSWTGVIERLLASGVKVMAPQIHSVASPLTPPILPVCLTRFPARSLQSLTPTAVR